MRPADTELCERKKTDEELFAIARAHMEKYSGAASLDRGLWDATVRLALRPRTEVAAPVWRHVLTDQLPDGPPCSPGTTLFAFRETEGHWEYDLPDLPKEKP